MDRERMVATRLFVGNLSYEATEDDVLELFLTAVDGVASVEVLMMRSGRSKGCAIVEMLSEEDAATAMAVLQDVELLGRPILVREDRFVDGPPPSGGGMGGGRAVGKARSPMAAAAAPTGTRLFVGNLSYEATEDDVLELFLTVVDGVASVEVLLMRSGRSKGCAIVEMLSVEDAVAAATALHNAELLGRPIIVRDDKFNGEGSDGGANEDAGPDLTNLTARLFVTNLPYRYAWQDLKDLFQEIGPVAYADVMRLRDGRSKGCGIVEFVDVEDARKAIDELQDCEIEGRYIYIREDREDRDYRGGNRRA